MNPTIRELISQVKVPNKFITGDSRITNKYIYSLLKKHRNTLIKQLDERFGLYRLIHLFQTWKCVDLIEAPTIAECCGVKSENIIYRIKRKLPNALNSDSGAIIARVTSIDGSQDLTPITPSEWNRKLENSELKYDKALYYFYSNGYLYFPNLKWKKIEIQAYFQETLKDENNCCVQEDNGCLSFLDEDFRIPEILLARCIELVNQEIFNTYQRIPSDEQIDKNETRKN